MNDTQPEALRQAQPVAYSYTSKITGAQGFSHHPLPRFTDVEHWNITPLYTTPPQRKPWVGLTDEEMKQIQMQSWNDYPDQKVKKFDSWECLRLAQAKLKEKNT